MQLPVLASFIRSGEALDDLGRGHAAAQEIESLPAVVGVDQRLRGKRADPARGVRAERADGEEAGGDGYAEGAARGVTRYD